MTVNLKWIRESRLLSYFYSLVLEISLFKTGRIAISQIVFSESAQDFRQDVWMVYIALFGVAFAIINSHATHVNEARHTYERVLSHTWMRLYSHLSYIRICVYTYICIYMFIYMYAHLSAHARRHLAQTVCVWCVCVCVCVHLCVCVYLCVCVCLLLAEYHLCVCQTVSWWVRLGLPRMVYLLATIQVMTWCVEVCCSHSCILLHDMPRISAHGLTNRYNPGDDMMCWSVCCSVLQCAAVIFAVCCVTRLRLSRVEYVLATIQAMTWCVAVCWIVLNCVAVCCSVF